MFRLDFSSLIPRRSSLSDKSGERPGPSENQATTLAEMWGCKHYYFIVRGRGEVSRLALAAANIDFEDIRMNREQWAEEKASEKLISFRYLPNTAGQVALDAGLCNTP